MVSMWLDLLSDDVCERVASHLCNRNLTESALHLAEVSDKLRAAVAAALDFFFELPDGCTLRDAQRWTTVFLPHVRECDIPSLNVAANPEEDLYPDKCQQRAADAVLPILQAPNLRFANISCDTRYLRHVVDSKSLRELRVNITSDPPMKQLFDMLSTLHLTKLDIFCRAGYYGSNLASIADILDDADEASTFSDSKLCPFRDPESLSVTCSAIATTCPYLEEVQVDCSCGGISDSDKLWQLIPFLPALRDVTIWETPPAEMLPVLRKLDSIRVAARNGFELATSFATQLTSLNLCCSSPLDTKQVASLANFSHLKILEVFLCEGAECRLPDAVRGFPLLEELDVGYFGPESSCVCKRCGLQCDLYPYPKATPNALLHAVQGLPSLRLLTISDFRLSMSEQVAILTSVGARLQSFSIPVTYQDEDPLDMLEALVYTAAKYCATLKTFDVSSMGWVWDKPVENSAKRQRLRAGLKRIQLRAPRVYVGSVESLVDEGIGLRSGECSHCFSS